ncbi:transglycosylase domain-containing protein [Curtobacterium ammoniigenes]|uniref:transglycosylase domain-containing protein n=1 Tax=Curtobacterium ammoniigenes TaxID=395387 RepID=UPI0008324260|nr:transglycosylase domain-containing protein [Curtobacterium ammoniigenes]
MSAQKTSASGRKPATAAGAFLGFIGFSVLAGLLIAVGVTPGIAVAGVTTTSTIGVFESLPEYITIGDLPQRNELYGYQDGKPVQFATIYDQNREELQYNQISDQLKHAAVDGEDRRFWEHGGVDVPSIIRAAVGSAAGGALGDSGGASTLTMQLVRNIKMQQALELPTQKEQIAAYNAATQQSIGRKLEEMKLAIGLAKKYSKTEILTAYLNIAYFGDNTYGVEAAAQHYYGKDASNLTPEEAASIIAIVQSPNQRNLSDPKFYAANKARRDVILKSMASAGDITPAQLQQSLATDPSQYVHLTPPTQGCDATSATGAQFFCEYAIDIVKSLPQLGATQKDRDAAWRTGGYKIQTSLNLDLNAQQKALIDSYAPNTEQRLALGGVIDSVEAGTGRILTMAQNKNYNQLPSCTAAGADPNACAQTTDTSINYSTDSQYGGSIGFQTGSTYKLFTLLEWLQQGHGLYETVNATPRAFTSYTACSTKVNVNYTPKNDEGSESGNRTVLSSTAASINVAYMAMAQQLDYCKIRSVAEKLGVHLGEPRTANASNFDKSGEKTTTAPQVNASSILGTNNIAPLTMAAAYAGVANNGVFCEPIAIDSITGPNGESLGGQKQNCTKAVDPAIAQTAVYALKSVLNYGTAAGGATYDGYGQDEFAKTGTTDNADQIWLIGGTDKVVTATWMGNTDGRTISLRQYGGPYGYYAGSRASLWRKAQTIVNTRYKATPFPTPTAKEINGNSIAVPDVSGQTVAQAEATLSADGFTPVNGGTQPGSAPAGTVTSTAPTAGMRLSQGASVTVYASDGSQVQVPNEVGKSVADAKSDLATQGYTNVQVSQTFQPGPAAQQCSVVAMSPAAGTTAPTSTSITLTLSGKKDGTDPGNCQ